MVYRLHGDIKFKAGDHMDNSSFHTFSEYMKNEEESPLTASMQDYLEMIYRLSKNTGFTRIHELSSALNVQPPSATKMVQKLAELRLLKYERYGILTLEEQGKKLGEELLERHNIIESFLSILGIPKNEILAETEKIEHTLSKNTTRCFKRFVEFSDINKDMVDEFRKFNKE